MGTAYAIWSLRPVPDYSSARIRVSSPFGVTFRVENTFLPADFDSSANPNDSGNLFGEIAAYRAAGIDGLFTDNPDIAVAEERETK